MAKGIFKRKEFWILFLIICLFLFLELAEIHLPGLHEDEALPASGTLQLLGKCPAVIYSVKIFNICFPLSLSEYAMAMESYILLPFVSIFGTNVFSIRFASILFGVVTLIFTYLLTKRFFDKTVALLAVFLSVISSTFITSTKLGLYTGSMSLTVAMGSLLCLLMWYTGKGDFYFYSGIFLLGLGITIRPWFFWFVSGLLLLSLVFRKELKRRAKGKFWKYCIVGLAVFCLGSFLMIYYNLKTDFTTVKYIFGHFRHTRCGVDNLNYINNLKRRLWVFFNHIINGTLLLREQGSWGNYISSKEIAKNHLYLFIFILSFIWLSLLTLFRKSNFSRKRLSFLLLLFLFILLQSPFTLSHLDGSHLFILYPLVALIIAIAFIEATRLNRKNKFVLLVLSIIFLLLIGTEINTTYKNSLSFFHRTGGIGNYSHTIYELAEWLKRNSPKYVVVLDWGLLHKIIYLTGGKVIPIVGTDILPKDEFIERAMLQGSDCLYVSHSPHFTNCPYYLRYFTEIAKEIGRDLVREKTFYQKDSKEVYIVYSSD